MNGAIAAAQQLQHAGDAPDLSADTAVQLGRLLAATLALAATLTHTQRQRRAS